MDYPKFNLLSGVQSSAQAWNAVTVGSFTNKDLIADPSYEGKAPLAPRGGLSPFSSTSAMWDKFKTVKPEILMEGGNAIDAAGILSSADELGLVAAKAKDASLRHFDAIWGTSAATALAAGLAARIKYENPALTALSVRALMIHSAEWTEPMKRAFLEGGGSVRTLLHACGWGMPNETKALASSDTYATFIAEQRIAPRLRGRPSGWSLRGRSTSTSATA